MVFHWFAIIYIDFKGFNKGSQNAFDRFNAGSNNSK